MGMALAIVGIAVAVLAVGYFLARRDRVRTDARQLARGQALAARLGLTRARAPRSTHFRAAGVVRGVPITLTLDNFHEPSSSYPSDRVTLRGTAPTRLGRCVVDRDAPSGYVLRATIDARGVHTLPDDPTPPWLAPTVVAAIHALPPYARVETYDCTLDVELISGPIDPPLDAALELIACVCAPAVASRPIAR
jgi:hypothetical protein